MPINAHCFTSTLLKTPFSISRRRWKTTFSRNTTTVMPSRILAATSVRGWARDCRRTFPRINIALKTTPCGAALQAMSQYTRMAIAAEQAMNTEDAARWTVPLSPHHTCVSTRHSGPIVAYSANSKLSPRIHFVDFHTATPCQTKWWMYSPASVPSGGIGLRPHAQTTPKEWVTTKTLPQYNHLSRWNKLVMQHLSLY